MPQSFIIVYDTKYLKHYSHSPNNYSHFVLGNLLELYIGLSDKGLLNRNITERSTNPSDRFDGLYDIFQNETDNAEATEDTEQLLAPTAEIRWSSQKAQSVRPYIDPFVKFIRHRLNIKAGSPDTLTYIRRPPKLLGRFIVNENSIMELLANIASERGLKFNAVYLENENFKNQVALMARTKILVGLHGAGLVNCLFCEPGTKVIEISPHPDFVYSGFPTICSIRGLGYSRVHATRWWFPTLLSVLRLPLIVQKKMARRIRRDRMLFLDIASIRTHVERVSRQHQ